MSCLSFFAGERALKHLQSNGLRPDDIEVVAGAAGAAKWLVLSQLDRMLFGEFFRRRQKPLHLLGSSIGAWRFAAVSQQDPLRGIEAFEKAYIEQHYSQKPGPREVTDKSFAIMQSFLGEEALEQILTHPSHRLSFLSVRSKSLLASEKKWPMLLGLGAAAFSNMLHTGAIHSFFERTLFYDPRSAPPYLQAKNFGSQAVALTQGNFRKALLSSGSIPLVMSGVADIEGALPGVYRDGGLIDYHLNVPFLPPESQKLVLFPHFENKLVPGWFDKQLFWRKPAPERMADVLVITPSPEFIAKLPLRKIPDRKDFYLFKDRDEDRFKYWRKVVSECRRLADEFHEVWEKGIIIERVQGLRF